jgi:hypothetical protein
MSQIVQVGEKGLESLVWHKASLPPTTTNHRRNNTVLPQCLIVLVPDHKGVYHASTIVLA